MDYRGKRYTKLIQVINEKNGVIFEALSEYSREESILKDILNLQGTVRVVNLEDIVKNANPEERVWKLTVKEIDDCNECDVDEYYYRANNLEDALRECYEEHSYIFEYDDNPQFVKYMEWFDDYTEERYKDKFELGGETYVYYGDLDINSEEYIRCKKEFLEGISPPGPWLVTKFLPMLDTYGMETNNGHNYRGLEFEELT